MMSIKGHIVDVKRCELPESKKPWLYLMPGFIDGHVHIETSMMVPREFAHVAVTHGTIGVIRDIKITDRHLMDTKHMSTIY